MAQYKYEKLISKYKALQKSAKPNEDKRIDIILKLDQSGFGFNDEITTEKLVLELVEKYGRRLVKECMNIKPSKKLLYVEGLRIATDRSNKKAG